MHVSLIDDVVLCVCIAAIRVYRVVGDVGMVMALQTIRVRVSDSPFV